MKRILIIIFIALLVLSCKAGDSMATPASGSPVVGSRPTTVTEPTPTITPVPDGLPCDLNNLTATATLEVIPAEVRASIILVNHKSFSCTLQGRPDIVLVDRGGIPFKIERLTSADPFQGETITLLPSASSRAEVTLKWLNWCRNVPEDGIFMLLTIPDYEGWVEAQFQDPNGQPLLDSPECLDYTKDSVMEIGILEPVQLGGNP